MKELVHIGYHKTASSWLQAQLFDNAEAGFCRYFEQPEIRDRLVLPNALDFDAESVRFFYQSLDKDPTKVSVISNERLSGNPHSGAYDSKEIALRLKQCFPNAKVLMVLREQVSALLSTYIQYIRVGGPCSVDDYFNPPERGKPVIPLFSFEHYEYLDLIKLYWELFSPENVLILDFVEFKKSPQDFCQRIIDFSDSPAKIELPYEKTKNKRISTLSSAFLRQSNKLFAKTRLNPAAISFKKNSSQTQSKTTAKESAGAYKKILSIDALIPDFVHRYFDAQLEKKIRKLVGDRYTKSNLELFELTGIDYR